MGEGGGGVGGDVNVEGNIQCAMLKVIFNRGGDVLSYNILRSKYEIPIALEISLNFQNKKNAIFLS